MEAAIILPVMILVLFGIIEFSRAFWTWHVAASAAQEGVRLATLDGATADDVEALVQQRVRDGGIQDEPAIAVDMDAPIQTRPGVNSPGASVAVTIDFQFLVLSNLVPGLAAPMAITSTAMTMREP